AAGAGGTWAGGWCAGGLAASTARAGGGAAGDGGGAAGAGLAAGLSTGFCTGFGAGPASGADSLMLATCAVSDTAPGCRCSPMAAELATTSVTRAPPTTDDNAPTLVQCTFLAGVATVFTASAAASPAPRAKARSDSAAVIT
ncbi:hypothetical protein CQY21_07640, partial [Mycolicibacterium boenickei]